MKGTEEEKNSRKISGFRFHSFLTICLEENKTYFQIKLEEKRAQNPIS